MSPAAEQIADLGQWVAIQWGSVEACMAGMDRYERYLDADRKRWERLLNVEDE